MTECERCGKELEPKGGILDLIGLSSYDGYECPRCGALVCSECYRKRKLETRGTSHDTCMVCETALNKR